MAKYPAEVWAALWVKNGGLPSKTREAVATVLCESGGDTDATSPVGARGGWQFMPGTLASEKCARDPDCSTREAVKLSNRGRDFSAWDCNPDSVARSGVGTGDEQYKQIYASLKTPLGDVPLPGPDLDFTNPFGPLSPLDPRDLFGLPGEIQKGGGGIPAPYGTGSLPDLIKQVTQMGAFFRGLGELILTPEGWLRLAKLFGGAIFILWGLRIVIRESTGSDPVRTATKTAGKAAEVAALAATIK